MATTKFFDDPNIKSFTTVPVDAANDNAISTAEFIAASRGVVKMFDILGGTAFMPVKSDMEGNIKKIETRLVEAPGESGTLQNLVTNAKAAKKQDPYDGLLWLTRGLDFTAKTLRHSAQNPNDELSTSFNTTYPHTLKPHHNFVVKGIFSVAMKATPTRASFVSNLSQDEAAGKAKMEEWLAALEAQVKIIKAYYYKNFNEEVVKGKGADQ